jgi:hypothetical protein
MMVELPSVIDYLRFFFLFSLLTIKVHNYLLPDNHARLARLGLATPAPGSARPKRLDQKI